MSVHVSSWAWRQEFSDPSAKLVLLKLADSANDIGIAWPSQQHLAQQCGMSERNVRFKLERLQALGLVEVQRSKKADGTWNPNVYKLSSGSPLPVELPASGKPPENHRKPTSSETLLEPKELMRKPTSTGSCPECGVRPPGTTTVTEHLENVHGVRAA